MNYQPLFEKFVEWGANLEHERWARWMKYMVKRMEQRKDGTLQFNDEDFGRWMQQAITPYEKLSEKEKESDRKETRNYLPFIRENYIPKAEIESKLKEMEAVPDKGDGDDVWDNLTKQRSVHVESYNQALKDILSWLSQSEGEIKK